MNKESTNRNIPRQPSPESWDRMRQKLERKGFIKRNRRVALWIWSGVAAGLVGLVLLWGIPQDTGNQPQNFVGIADPQGVEQGLEAPVQRSGDADQMKYQTGLSAGRGRGSGSQEWTKENLEPFQMNQSTAREPDPSFPDTIDPIRTKLGFATTSDEPGLLARDTSGKPTVQDLDIPGSQPPNQDLDIPGTQPPNQELALSKAVPDPEANGPKKPVLHSKPWSLGVFGALEQNQWVSRAVDISQDSIYAHRVGGPDQDRGYYVRLELGYALDPRWQVTGYLALAQRLEEYWQVKKGGPSPEQFNAQQQQYKFYVNGRYLESGLGLAYIVPVRVLDLQPYAGLEMSATFQQKRSNIDQSNPAYTGGSGGPVVTGNSTKVYGSEPMHGYRYQLYLGAAYAVSNKWTLHTRLQYSADLQHRVDHPDYPSLKSDHLGNAFGLGLGLNRSF